MEWIRFALPAVLFIGILFIFLDQRRRRRKNKLLLTLAVLGALSLISHMLRLAEYYSG